MIRQENVLLHQIFEDLFLTHEDGLPEKVAVWHIPDPRQLLVSAGKRTLATEQRDLIDCVPDTKPSCEIHSISFSELNKSASLLAEQITKGLQKVDAIIQNSDSFGSSDGGNEEQTAQAHSVVAVFMPPGISRIVTQIACMKLHLAYLPLDRQLSVGRIVQILELISPIVMICSKDYYDMLFSTRAGEQTDQFASYFNDKLDSLTCAVSGIPVLIYEHLMSTGPSCRETLVSPSRGIALGQVENTTKPLFPNTRDPVVVVFFTSGSTTSGPKIVRLRNSQLVNRLQWQWMSTVEMDAAGNWKVKHPTEVAHQQKNEVVLSSTACVFVDAFTELYSALFAGIPVVVPGGLHCASEVCVSDVRILYSLIRFFRITRLTTVPNQLNIWMNQMRLIDSKVGNEELASLNTIVVSGDVLLPELACTFFRLPLGRGARLLNFYGTTEVAGDVTAAVFHNEQEVRRTTKNIERSGHGDSLVETSSFVTVGKPIFNTTIFVVKRREEEQCQSAFSAGDRSRLSVLGDPVNMVDWGSMGYQISELGCVGEVAVIGVPVGVYSGNKGVKRVVRPETNNLAPEPLRNHAVYFPGDLGFISPDDHLLYVCGRSDELVKINAVGFLASEVDRILLRIKEHCMHKPSEMSWMEKKVANISESVTLPTQHPSNGTKHLVCFYVVTADNSSLCGQVDLTSTNSKPGIEERIEYHSHLAILKPQSPEWTLLSPKPSELSTTVANYLPVYIRPIFLAVNRLPVMPTSGKVDKQRLRTLYQDTLTLERENHPPSEQSSENVTSGELLQVFKNGDKRTKGPSYREQARRVLASILGVESTPSQERDGRPRDDEDFYLIGGNSLMAVLALESLRQLGFKVHLETFYQTSTIGRILDSLVPPGFAQLCTGNPTETGGLRESIVPKVFPLHTEFEFLEQKQAIRIQEWIEGTTCNGVSRGPSFNDIVQFLADVFERKDHLAHAFQLSRAELETAASTYCKPNGNGIVLTVTCQPIDGDERFEKHKEKLIGVLLSVPSESLPVLPCTPKLSQLQRYFDFCYALDEMDKRHIIQTNGKDALLTVVMAGVMPPQSEELYRNPKSHGNCWDRVMLEILARLENQLLLIAKTRGFTTVDTLNTCETTKEVCADLGYRLVKCNRMKTFVTAEQVLVGSMYHEHVSYYMIKHLSD